ncbi:MAG: LacI family DNA-binding transcriptional regulator [Verrucomicrobiota bacterium]
MPSKRVTIKDIAKECGLSIGAVSQALRPTPGSSIKTSAKTAELVRKVAEKLNYRPHTGARATRLNRFNNLGFFVAKDEHSYLPQGYIDGIHDAALSRDFRLSLIRLPYDPTLLKDSLPKLFREQSIDALVIASYSSLSAAIHEELKNAHYPIIYLNDKHPYNSVYVDDVVGGRMMTQHLLEKGYKNIQYTYRKPKGNPSLKSLHHSQKDRHNAYRKAMKEAGLPENIVALPTTDSLDPLNRVETRQLFPNGRPDAIMSYDDNLASGIGKTLFKENIRVPQDLALTGYNGDLISRAAWLNLTTVKVPTFTMGQIAIEMALELINAKDKDQIKSRKVTPSLIPGNSIR